jgi:xylose isomerase
VERETLSRPVAERYAGWDAGLGSAILAGRETLASLESKVASGAIDPRPVSGRQEELENAVNQVIWTADQAARVGAAR